MVAINGVVKLSTCWQSDHSRRRRLVDYTGVLLDRNLTSLTAHPMTPHRRQGLNNALEDAALLAEQLTAVHHGAKAQPEAMADYETEMKSRALREIPISLAQATMVHDWDKLMVSEIVRVQLTRQLTPFRASR